MTRIWPYLLTVAALALAFVVDRYVVTWLPLMVVYTVPILVAAWLLSPRETLAALVFALAVGVVHTTLKIGPNTATIFAAAGVLCSGMLGYRLAVLREQALAHAAERERWLRDAAHRVRQPLTVGFGYSQILDQKMGTTDACRAQCPLHDYAEKVVDHLAKTADELAEVIGDRPPERPED